MFTPEHLRSRELPATYAISVRSWPRGVGLEKRSVLQTSVEYYHNAMGSTQWGFDDRCARGTMQFSYTYLDLRRLDIVKVVEIVICHLLV